MLTFLYLWGEKWPFDVCRLMSFSLTMLLSQEKKIFKDLIKDSRFYSNFGFYILSVYTI